MKKMEWSWKSPAAIAFYVFFLLKITNVISWSWFWIFFPLLLGYILLVINNVIADYENEN